MTLLPASFAQSQGSGQPLVTTSRKAQLDTLIKQEAWASALPVLFDRLEEEKQAAAWADYSATALQTAVALGKLQRTDSSLVLLDQVLTTLKTARYDTTLTTASLWSYMATNYARAERFQEALEARQKAISIFEQHHYLGDKLAHAYKTAAQALVRFDNHTLARQYFEAGIRADTSGKYRASIYAQLANQAHFQGNESDVMRFFQLGMAEPIKTPEDVAHLSANGASAFMAAGRYEEAKAMLHTAMAYFDQEPKMRLDNRLRVMTQMADIAVRQQAPASALRYYRQAEAESKKYIAYKSREVAKLYNEWARYWQQEGQPDSALLYYQKAMVQAFPKFNSLNTKYNPSLNEVWLESQAMDATFGKALLLAKRPAPTQEEAMNAAYCFELAFLVSDRMRHTYGNDADKITLAEHLRPTLNTAVLHLCNQYRTDQNPAHLIALFYLLEKTRANALSDALRQQRALALSGIPDSLLRREESLRRETANLEYELLKSGPSRDSAAATRLQDALLKKTMTHSQLLRRMQDQYPQFRQYEQADRIAEPKEVAQALPDSAALMMWHDAGDRYICLTLQRGHLSLHEVMADSTLQGALAGFIQALSDKTSQERAPQALLTTARYFGEKLLPTPVLSAARTCIIVPDGLLCRLPFEVLLTAPPAGSLGQAPYLVRSHTVQYAWSGKLLTQSYSLAAPKGMLHLAPFVTDARDGLSILPNSLRDVPAALHTCLLSGDEAGAARFLEEAPDFSVLHLSTHASAAGNREPGIEFYDSRLALSQVYAQRLRASLVSLSACETGAGQVAGNEGVLSLARAFAYAGAQSLVASLWSVNESSTADLFSAFYEELKQGRPRAEALRRAKLRYLDSAELDARKLPFHWAAFTLTGMDGPVPMEPRSKVWWWLSGMVLVLALLWGLRGCLNLSHWV